MWTPVNVNVSWSLRSYRILIAVILCGPHERRLINDLMRSYKTLERPVANESDAVVLKFGLTLQQIMDVVSQNLVFKRFS